MKSARCPLKNKIAEGAESTLSVPCHTALRQSLSFPWMLFLPFLLLLHGSLRDDCISLRFSACGCESSLSSGSAQLSSQRSFCAPPLILQVLQNQVLGVFSEEKNSISSPCCCLLCILCGVREEVGHSFLSIWLFRCVRNTQGSTAKRDEQDNPRSNRIFPHSVVNLLIKIKTFFFFLL